MDTLKRLLLFDSHFDLPHLFLLEDVDDLEKARISRGR